MNIQGLYRAFVLGLVWYGKAVWERSMGNQLGTTTALEGLEDLFNYYPWIRIARRRP